MNKGGSASFRGVESAQSLNEAEHNSPCSSDSARDGSIPGLLALQALNGKFPATHA